MENYVIFGDTHFAERLYSHIQMEGEHNVLAFTQQKEWVSAPVIKGVKVLPF